ncbi:MAG TPA: hypothetical protein VET27_17475 [Mycobacterium sp.]|nr:hypothetical protein [Mycobacterium sp.]
MRSQRQVVGQFYGLQYGHRVVSALVSALVSARRTKDVWVQAG